MTLCVMILSTTASSLLWLKGVYPMNNKPRGYAILITTSETRQGTEVDEQNIENLFSQLQFLVLKYKDKTKKVKKLMLVNV